VIAVGSVQLAQRHPEVSPWFPVLLLDLPDLGNALLHLAQAHPGQSPGLADGAALPPPDLPAGRAHVFHDDEARRMLMRNNRTSPYLLGLLAC
jgi:UDP-GlcNAc:undecaprenyl-phosphate GlcNAc-1-phosphate transferase